MLGAESVAASLLATLKAELPGRLATIRSTVGASAVELPDPKEWQDFEESRGTWDMARTPLVQVVARSASGPKSVSRAPAGDEWEWRYNVQLLVVLHAGLGEGWRSADRVRKRYLLALREILWALSSDTMRVDRATVTERMYTPRATANGATVQADATLTFDLLAIETRERTVLGKANRIEIHVVPVAIDDPMPTTPPDPLPDPIVVP